MAPIPFLLSFLVFIVVLAIVIIGVRWLLGVAGIAIPQPLMIILGLICFLILLLFFLNFTGMYSPGFFHPR